MLHGLMMDRPLLTSMLLDYAADIHPNEGLVSALHDGRVVRQTYAETRGRVARLAHALKALGVGPGDRVATLAWNGFRHFELYYAISGIGAVCHTINPRLFPDQLSYIVGHAEDRVLFFDPSLAQLVADMRGRWPEGLTLVVMDENAALARACGLDDALVYEALLANHPDRFDWPLLDENTASGLCYTSGTTGNPKGVLYSHRSTVLHAMGSVLEGMHLYGPGRRILPIVPLFHVNAWCLPFAMPLTGATMVLPGPRLDGPTLFALMDAEKVNNAWGVMTVWQGLLDEMRAKGRKPAGLGTAIIGGAAIPRPFLKSLVSEFGLEVIQGWGMTELSPRGTFGPLSPAMKALPEEERIDLMEFQGRRIFGIELKLADEDGNTLPHDGKAVGELRARGWAVASGYFNDAKAGEGLLDEGGWLRTGDMACIRPDGFLRIVDRAKDLVKSGGEWISSLELESIALNCPGIAQCAVVAAPDPKWGERPALFVVRRSGAEVDADTIKAHMAARLAKWQVPERITFVDRLPMTATGKISKLQLRREWFSPDSGAQA